MSTKQYGSCEQICLPSYIDQRRNSFTCECGIGYDKSPTDPKSCVEVDSFILVSMATQIRGFSMTEESNHRFEDDAVSPIGPAGNNK